MALILIFFVYFNILAIFRNPSGSQWKIREPLILDPYVSIYLTPGPKFKNR